MLKEEYEYKGYFVEIHEHPIYHDFEFVVKQNNEIKFTNIRFHKTIDEVRKVVHETIDTYQETCK